MNHVYFGYEVTSRCNNDCLYCYNVWKYNRPYPAGELSLSQIKSLFNKVLSEVKPLGITLTGGEPLLRKDIFEIISFLSEKNVKVGLSTNATLLDENIVEKLRDSGIAFLEVSLPSISSDVHQNICCTGSAAKLKNAMLAIRKTKIPFTTSFVITKLNFRDIVDVAEISFAFGAENLALNRFVATGKGLLNQEKLSPDDNELRYVLSAADEVSRRLNFFIDVTVPVESCLINHAKYPHLNFWSCMCGLIKWTIDPLGNLRICEQNDFILGSLIDQSFTSLYKNKQVNCFRESYLRNNCPSCERFRYCAGGCRVLNNKK